MAEKERRALGLMSWSEATVVLSDHVARQEKGLTSSLPPGGGGEAMAKVKHYKYTKEPVWNF